MRLRGVYIRNSYGIYAISTMQVSFRRLLRQEVKLVENDGNAANCRMGGVVGYTNLKPHRASKPLVQAWQQRTASRQDNAIVRDVGGEPWFNVRYKFLSSKHSQRPFDQVQPAAGQFRAMRRTYLPSRRTPHRCLRMV